MRISRHSAVCLPFIGENIFLHLANDQTSSVVILKCRMGRNFVVCSLEVSLRIISFRAPVWAPCLKFWLPKGNS